MSTSSPLSSSTRSRLLLSASSLRVSLVNQLSAYESELTKCKVELETVQQQVKQKNQQIEQLETNIKQLQEHQITRSFHQQFPCSSCSAVELSQKQQNILLCEKLQDFHQIQRQVEGILQDIGTALTDKEKNELEAAHLLCSSPALSGQRIVFNKLKIENSIFQQEIQRLRRILDEKEQLIRELKSERQREKVYQVESALLIEQLREAIDKTIKDAKRRENEMKEEKELSITELQKIIKQLTEHEQTTRNLENSESYHINSSLSNSNSFR
jgi:hypothetical protein